MALAALAVIANARAEETVSGYFNWGKPGTLSPAFPAPTSSNRQGQTITGTTFTSEGISFAVDDSQVSEQSRKARFYFGYDTQEVELRAYSNSDVVVTAPEGMTVKSISFTGPQADGDFMESYDEKSSWNGGTWTASEAAQEVRFYVGTRCELITTTVVCVAAAGVDDIMADGNGGVERWFDLRGCELAERPTAAGLYICRQGTKTRKVIVR